MRREVVVTGDKASAYRFAVLPEGENLPLGNTALEVPYFSNSFVYDTWNAADGTLIDSRSGEIGATWTLASGVDTVRCSGVGASGHIYSTENVGGGVEYYASGLPPSAAYMVSAQYQMRSAMIGVVDGIGVSLHKQVGANTRLLGWYNNQLTRWELYETIAGVDTQQVNSVVNIPTTVFWPQVSLVVAGTLVTLIAQGVVVASLTTTITVANRAGLRTFNLNTASTANSKLHLGAYTASS